MGEAAEGASQGHNLLDGSQGRPRGEEGLCLGASQVGLHVTRFFLLKVFSVLIEASVNLFIQFSRFYWGAGFRIRIDLMRIRIRIRFQHFF
jgi:hypothetical protein